MARNAIESDFRSSKMAAGKHFVEKIKKIIVAYWSEMPRNAIKSDFRSSKMAQIGLPNWPPAAILKKNIKKKLRIDLKWREMHSKVIFRHPKWTQAAILWKKSKKIKVVYWSEMARNAIKSDFRSSQMAAGSHFVKKVAYWSEMMRNAIKSDFRSSKMVAGSHFVKKKDLKCREMWSKFIFGHPKWGGGGGGEASQWPACKPFLGKYTNSSFVFIWLKLAVFMVLRHYWKICTNNIYVLWNTPDHDTCPINPQEPLHVYAHN